jgi:hypothetical protein
MRQRLDHNMYNATSHVSLTLLAWCRAGGREAERRTWNGSVHRERWVQRRRDLVESGLPRWWSRCGVPCAQSSLRAAKCADRAVRPAGAVIDRGLPEWQTPRRAVRMTNRGWPDVADPPRNWALEAGGAELVERAAPAASTSALIYLAGMVRTPSMVPGLAFRTSCVGFDVKEHRRYSMRPLRPQLYVSTLLPRPHL